jgi:hypothetical protein
LLRLLRWLLLRRLLLRRLLLWQLLRRLLLRRLLLRMLMLWQRRLRGGIAPTRGGLCVQCCKPGGQLLALFGAPTLKPQEFGELYVTPIGATLATAGGVFVFVLTPVAKAARTGRMKLASNCGRSPSRGHSPRMLLAVGCVVHLFTVLILRDTPVEITAILLLVSFLLLDV